MGADIERARQLLVSMGLEPDQVLAEGEAIAAAFVGVELLRSGSRAGAGDVEKEQESNE